MKAAVTRKAGNPSVIEIQELPIPETKPGWVLIKNKAFGLNRSELFTRRGHSPNVNFPIVQGIECVGEVEHDPSGTYAKGQQVAAIMGQMGRDYNGGYAEYTLVPQKVIFPFKSSLPWKVLGAIPEMFQTTSGSLNQALELQEGDTLLIRGGTSSIGMMACQLAKAMGATVISTTRQESKRTALIQNGSDHVLIDNGEIYSNLKQLFPQGVNKVLELIGTRTLKDSLKCIAPKGTVCMTGILGNEWTMPQFTPMGDIPPLGRLTVYMGDVENLTKTDLQNFIDMVEQGSIKLNIDRYYKLTEVAEAHTYMESNQNKGKIVVEI